MPDGTDVILSTFFHSQIIVNDIFLAQTNQCIYLAPRLLNLC